MTDSIEREYRRAIVQLLVLGYPADARRLHEELKVYKTSVEV